MDKQKFAVLASRRTDVACKLALRKLKSEVKCDVIYFIWRAYFRSVMSDKNGAFQIFSGRN